MHWYQAALLIGAVVAALLAWDRRATLWIFLGVVSGVSSAIWHDSGMPYGAAFGAATNMAICTAIYLNWQWRWELQIAKCFMTMILIDAIWLWGLIPSHFWFAVSLEIVNWIALLIIGATGIAERARQHGILSRGYGYGWARAVHRTLWEHRGSRPPWWQVP